MERINKIMEKYGVLWEYEDKLDIFYTTDKTEWRLDNYLESLFKEEWSAEGILMLVQQYGKITIKDYEKFVLQTGTDKRLVQLKKHFDIGDISIRYSKGSERYKTTTEYVQLSVLIGNDEDLLDRLIEGYKFKKMFEPETYSSLNLQLKIMNIVAELLEEVDTGLIELQKELKTEIKREVLKWKTSKPY